MSGHAAADSTVQTPGETIRIAVQGLLGDPASGRIHKVISARRWSARPLSKDPSRPIEGIVCATVWPTRALNSDERWFDEIYVWTEGFRPSTTQRARIQSTTLESAFQMLEREQVDRVGVTLSFGTVERFLDRLVESFESHALVTHRMVVLMRGSVARLRSRYRLRAFIHYLRRLHIPIGYRVATPGITMELKAFDLVQPDFAQLHAPNSSRTEFWEDFALEARVAGVGTEWMIIAGLESGQQLAMARQVGIRFGQGSAVRPAYAPITAARRKTSVHGLQFGSGDQILD